MRLVELNSNETEEKRKKGQKVKEEVTVEISSSQTTGVFVTGVSLSRETRV